jgi:hypothetical protein
MRVELLTSPANRQVLNGIYLSKWLLDAEYI